MNQLMGDNLHKHYRRGKHPQAIKKGGVALTGAPWPGEVQYVWDGGRLLMMTCCSVNCGVTDVGYASAPQDECWHGQQARGEEVVLSTAHPAGGSTSTPCHHLLTSMFKIHFLSSVEHKKRCFGHLRCYEKLSNKCCLTDFNI